MDYPGEDPAHVVDARGHFYAANDGHFYFPGTGKRAKFFGTNFMVNTIFPPNSDAPQQAGEYSGIVPPDAADQLATRLARMGVNVVRLHFIDGGYARPVSIWDPSYPNDTRHFDPLQVKRLDYLIFALKRQGIYCDINLHAGRQFRSQDGVKDYNLFPDTSFNKPATQFDPAMIRLQQEYAAQLLTHVNPYTHLRLADDPAIAFVEISNEDSMLYSFANDQLAGFADVSTCFQGMACGLPASYSADLDRLWNVWLQNKYASDAALIAAWTSSGAGSDRFSGSLNFDASGPVGWVLRTFNGAQGLVSPDSPPSAQPATSAHIKITATRDPMGRTARSRGALAAEWTTLRSKCHSKGNGRNGCSGRSDAGSGAVRVLPDRREFNATASWQTRTATFRANVTNTGHVQLNLDAGAAQGDLWIADVAITPHISSGSCPENLSLTLCETANYIATKFV